MIVQVDESGLLGVTQQLSQFGSDFSQQPHHNPSQNPFASPVKPLPDGGAPLFSSPSPSLITHAGSLPSTPSSGGDGTTGGGIVPSSHVRAALFQVSHQGLLAYLSPPALNAASNYAQPICCDWWHLYINLRFSQNLNILRSYWHS